MKKHIMSIAAIAAIFTTGAMAFDTNSAGAIRTFPSNTASSINSGAAPASSALTKVGTQGDALIYPLFVQDGNYSSEIVVRNTSNKAVVAKAVLYAGDDSQELLDFNIFLSGKDVCRFTLKDNKIYSEDGSLKIDGTKPIDIASNNLTDYDKLKFASSKEPFSFDFSQSTVPLIKYKNGYIAIFGMVELDPMTKDNTVLTTGAYLQGSTVAFHNDHKSIYAAYAQLLDDKRPGWRDITNKAVLKESVFISNVTASPNVTLPASVTWNTSSTATQTVAIQSVSPDTLSGEVRLINSAAKTDMIINATALQNFTENANSGMLWVEREYASISDRCLDGNGQYDAACITRDAQAFRVTNATYNYANKSNNGVTDNKMYITQPYKRILIQRFGNNTNGYVGTSKVVHTLRTGAGTRFTSTALVYDENEQFPATAVTTTGLNLSGTANTANPVNGYAREVAAIPSSAFEQNSNVKSKFGDKDGFAEFNVGVPAIITQMVATKSGDAFVTNWVYSNTK